MVDHQNCRLPRDVLRARRTCDSSTVQLAFFWRDLDEHIYTCKCGASVTTFVRRPRKAV